jgi:hypothetical protein
MLMTFVRRCAAVLVFGVVFVINPFYVAGCGSSEHEEDRARARAAEMQLLEKLDDVNGEGSFVFDDGGVQYELLLELSQAKAPEAESARAPAQESFMAVAHACGQHTFYQSASACDTLYELAVEGSFTLRRLGDSPETIATDVAVTGRLREYGELSLQIGEAGWLAFSETEPGDLELSRFVAADIGGEPFDLSE